MYKYDDTEHPWRHVREDAAFQRTYRRIGRDLKIGQLWVMLAIVIMLTTTIGGAVLASGFYLPPVEGELGKMLMKVNSNQLIVGCCFAVIQCLFLYMGSKYMYRLTVWQIVPVALAGLAGIAYFLSIPETRLMSLAVAIVFSPYFLCAGILTLSWRAKLYLAYMSGDFK